MKYEQWKNFNDGDWSSKINIENFIYLNYTEYKGDASFLENSTSDTDMLWKIVMELNESERKAGGVFNLDTKIISTITSHGAGYIDKNLEKIVGLQTDEPFKRGLLPFAGIRNVVSSAKDYGYEIDQEVIDIFTKYRKTHSDGVYSAYTPEMRNARRAGIITSLPDTYSRGRVIGDYRRIALYGVDFLIDEREEIKSKTNFSNMNNDIIRDREEITEQIKALNELKELATIYGCNIAQPSKTFQEAVQAIYFGYLAATKQQNGAAMSLGRVSTFLDIYAQRELISGEINEIEIQEIVDQFVMKLRIVKFIRSEEYNNLFSGDPVWVTESIGGMINDKISLVTKNSFRFLHTLYNLGPSPEPNLTVLWSPQLPNEFKKYVAKVAIDTSAIQIENDELMRNAFGSDYGIACCVSPMKIGKQTQFFGARANLPKMILYAINGGIDEKLKIQVGPERIVISTETITWDQIADNFHFYFEWCVKMYVNALNIIHYMHDKYAYESLQLGLHDSDIERIFATGIAGLSVATDSISALKYADEIRVIRDENGLAKDFEVIGSYPQFGNNIDKVDNIAYNLIVMFMEEVRKHETYRNSTPSLSILTITSNVVYGNKTGATPDGRKSGVPFAPGANPLHGRDKMGALASLESVAKLPFEYSKDGISNTFTIVPSALGKTSVEQTNNLVTIIDGYLSYNGGQHINVNVLNRETLLDAMRQPSKYPQLTIRVSGYAVNFTKLTREQQEDVISRTFHGKM